MDIKVLYKRLIDERKTEHKYYESYKNFCETAQTWEFSDPISKDDKDFLKKLLYHNNGVASRGMSNFSERDFDKLITDISFMTCLTTFMKEPSTKHFIDFQDEWIKLATRNNSLLINRVAAARTPDVSSTVDRTKFENIFIWFQDEKIIAEYTGAEDWYSKNQYLMSKLHELFADEIVAEKTDKYYLSIFVWELYRMVVEPMTLNKQLIMYGAPGTGKTYQAQTRTSRFFDIWKMTYAPTSSYTYESQTVQVQFHPSYSYEDFIEGLRPILENDTSQLRLQNGVFKEFCRNAAKWEMDVFHFDPSLDWSTLTVKELKQNDTNRKKFQGSHWDHIFDAKDNNQSKLVSDLIPPFFFLIDEINRAELSRVFGELMYCLEYRGVRGRIKTQYSNLNDDDTGMLKCGQNIMFFIPTNIYILGTMNTIDRSVESFDFALRRRFIWQEVSPSIELLENHLVQKWEPLAKNLEELNKLIENEPLLGRDYRVGHAYLMNLPYSTRLGENAVRTMVWNDRIRPLIAEYLRGTGKETELLEKFSKAFGI